MKLRPYLLIFSSFIFAFITASLMVKSCVNWIEEVDILYILSLTLILIYFSSSKKIFYFIGLPFNLGFALYSWVGLSFGLPNYAYFVSIFNTNTNEIKDFLKFIPLTNFFYPIEIIFGSFVYFYTAQLSKIELIKSKVFNALAMLFLFATVLPINIYYKELFKSMEVTYNVLKVTNNSKNIKPSWTEVKREGKQYKTYVLVIGESQRRDYFNAYGYPVKNTPFLSSSKGFLVEGLSSGGENTVSSLEKMLTNVKAFKAGGDLNSNIIDLAKLAGLKTYWLSNQGHYGAWENQVSIIGDRADFIDYKNNTIDDYANISKSKAKLNDYLLLPKLEKILNTPIEGDRLIVLHLIGSHQDACNMYEGLKDPFKVSHIKYGYLTCYMNTIKKTDDLLNKIFNLLETDYQKNKANTFSMLYFADHGEIHSTMPYGNIDVITLIHPFAHSANQYKIPLFKVSSDDTKRTTCKAFKSGLNFTNGLASWLGITAKQIDPNYSLFDCKDDPSDYGLSEIIDPQSTAKDGKAVDISKFIVN